MAQLAHELEADQCRAAVARLHERHGWSLLDHTIWAVVAFGHVRNGITADPGCAAFYTYSEALHRACSGEDGAHRQEQGYTELGQFLFQLASRSYPDVSADATQLALMNIYRTFAQCDQPGWFFAFAKYKLKDAAKTIRLHEQRYQRLVVQRLDHSRLRDVLPDQQQPDVCARITDNEDRRLLERYREDFLRSHPRAARQFDAVWLKYIAGLSDSEISHKLGVSISEVHTLRCRGIKKLQSDPGWRALAAEFSIYVEPI